ncbi:hypothetical protein LZ30DRAFT_694795 [Colletotrichum cereale]|nr:hypothetical protein LZ30DRAFT_694795 [Colletotrichum cereale]
MHAPELDLLPQKKQDRTNKNFEKVAPLVNSNTNPLKERVYPVPLRKTPANFVCRRSRTTKAHLDPMSSNSLKHMRGRNCSTLWVEKLKAYAGEDSRHPTPTSFVVADTGVIDLQGPDPNELLPLA